MLARILSAIAIAAATSSCALTPAPHSGQEQVQIKPDSNFASYAATADSFGIAKAIGAACSMAASKGDCYEAFLVVPAS